MKANKLLLLILMLMTGSISTSAQFNPNNPDEPDTPPTITTRYTLTLQSQPQGLGTPFSINAVTQHEAGEALANIRALAVNNYTFTGWKEGDTLLSTDATLDSYTMPAHDVLLTACYVFTPGSPDEPDKPDLPPLPVYSTVTLNANPAAGGTATGGGSLLVGTTTTLRATAAQYYKFRDWTKDGTVISTQPVFPYTVETGNPQLTANFIADYHPDNPDEPDKPAPDAELSPSHRLYLMASPESAGYFNRESGQLVTKGERVALQAYNNAWYTFQRWTDAEGLTVSTSYNFSYTMPDADATLTAHYAYTPPASPDEPGQTTGKLHIYVLEATGSVGQLIVLPVYLENPQTARNLSVDVQLPQGFTLHADDITLKARAAGHQLTVSDRGNNTYRLQLQSSTPFTGSNGKLLDLPITIGDDVRQGQAYTVKLSRGLVDTQQDVPLRNGTVYVEKQNETGLYASFTYDKADDRVAFTNHSSPNVRRLLWDFGDGTTSTDPSPLHVYLAPGLYTVRLTVTGQADTDVAEMGVLVNPPSTWRTEGYYYLDTSQHGVRSFATVDELFAFVTRSPLGGDVVISLEAGHNYNYLLTDDHIQQFSNFLQQLAATDHTLTLARHGQGTPPVINFSNPDSSINPDAVGLFLQMESNILLDGAVMQLWGLMFDPSALHRLKGQTVASGETTRVEDFKAIAPALSYNWTLTTATDSAPTEGQETLPAFAIDNKTGRNLMLDYHVTATYNGTELFDWDYTVEVLPSTISPDLTLRHIEVSKTSLQPGDQLTVTWQALNAGGNKLIGGWRETLYLEGEGGNTVQIGSVYCDKELEAGDALTRIATVTLPQLPGVSGQVRLRLSMTPNAEANEPTSNSENNTVHGPLLTLGKRLALQLPATYLKEGDTSQRYVKALLQRSGSWQQVEVFNVRVVGDDRLTADQAVPIAKGQSGAYFNMTVKDNSQVDADSVFYISISGNDYPEVSARIVVEDNEYSPVMLRASKTDITEGDSFQLTASIAEATSHDIVLSLTAEHPARFVLPATMTIPAGQASATVDVTATDDDVPSLDLTTQFVAYAEGYQRAETLVMLHDNDLPLLELELTPGIVKEGDGPMSVVGTLRRTTNKDSKITVRLSDDSNGGLYLGQTKLELAKGVEEVNFHLGPIDNNQVDSDRIYTLTAAVWISSCSCSAAGQAAGAVSAKLHVFDDDGPSLKLTAANSTVKEGDKTMLTVTRNTETANPLTVTLKSSADGLLSYNSSLTILAGQTKASVEVTALKNSIEGDSQTITITAEADGFSPGACWMMLTDQTLPDAQITDFMTDKSEDMVAGIVKLTIVVQNEGSAPLTDATPVSIYRRGSSSPIAKLYTQTILAPGEHETINGTFVLPATVGNYAYYAVVNDDGRVREISSRNNISSERVINVLPPYKATIQTDKQSYQQGEKVYISGYLEGQKTMLTDAELYVINGNVRESFAITTDADGRFSFQWQPYSLQMGQFGIGVCYPGEDLRQAMATVNIYGLRRVGSNFVTCDVTQGETYDGTITIENPGVLPLTGVKAEVVESPEDCDVKLSMPTTIGSQQKVQLRYAINGVQPHYDNQWHPIQLKVQTAEGATMRQTLYYYCRSPRAQLVVSETQINTTMTKGKTRDYVLYLTNYGRGSTGSISLELPSWMQCATGKTLPSLTQNDTATVMLRLQPTDDMQLNVPQEGTIGINCQNGNGIQVDFCITPVSESKGTLAVEVRDEYFYQDGTHLQAAEVVVRNPVTKTLVVQGVSDAGGLCSFTLPEGYYQVSVTANGHDAYQNTILVSPGVETKKVVNLSVVGVKVDWKVEETEVEDRYEVVSSLVYSTNVPVPVVVLDVPKRVAADSLQAGESLVFYATLTNKGLVRAVDVSLLLPSGFNQLSFEALSDYQGLELAAGESVTIPVKVSRFRNAASRQIRIKSTDNDPCVGYPGTLYFWECGNDRKWHRYGVCLQLGSCDSDDPRTWNQEPNPTGDEIKPGGWPIGTSIANQPNLPGTGTIGRYVKSEDNQQKTAEVEDKGCEPCQNEFMGEVAKCIPGLGVVVTAIQAIGNTVATSNKCLHALFRDDLELTQKLSLCPFTSDFAELLEFCETLWLSISHIPDSINSDGFTERLKVAIDETFKDLVDSILKDFEVGERGIAGQTWEDNTALSESTNPVNHQSITELTWESKFALLESRNPEFAKMRKKADELIEKLESLKKKSDKIVKTSEDLIDADRANVIEVLRCTCELTGAIGSVLQETPMFKKVGKKMEKASKFVNKYKCWFDLADYECKYDGASSRGIAKNSKGIGNKEIDRFIEAMKAYVNEQVAGDIIKEEVFGDSIWMDVPVAQLLPLYLYLTGNTAQQESMWRYVLKPELVTFEQFDAFVKRWNTIFNNSQGSLDLEKIRQQMDVIDGSEMYLEQSGFNSFEELIQDRYTRMIESPKMNSVCARISLSLPQTLQFTRQAFRGTLTVFNGHEKTAMRDLKLALTVTDGTRMATPHEFDIHTEKLQGFSGELSLGSGWTLDAQQTGTATILFTPTKYAAPTELTEWSFGGVLSYTDPYTGKELRRELYPVTLTVSPSPVLDLDYFLQRDIYGDDPLTEDTVESVAPAEFALLINNKGYGDARNVQMTTRQPQIVENEKGLAVTFSLLNGEQGNLMLSDSYVNDFGTIPAQSQTYAQWWLLSSLLGHFTNYDVTVNHLTSNDNADLSLIDRVRIHELIHGFTLDDGRRGFLVNDLPDINDLPDAIYFTDASSADVTIATDASVSRHGDGYLLRVNTDKPGWYYGSLQDPTGGRLELTNVVSQSYGGQLPKDNMWQTSRTLNDGQDWLYENRLHYIVQLKEGGESYLLSFQTPETVGVNEMVQSNGSQIKFLPSVSGNWLSVIGDFSELHRLSVYDTRGIRRLFMSGLRPGQSIYTGSLPTGIYYVVVETDKGVYRVKAMKH